MASFMVKKSSLTGEVWVPPSKSHTLRAVLFASLAKGKSFIHNHLHSPDAEAMINACRLFGADIQVDSNKISVSGLNGKIDHAEDVINAGNSGIVLRFCTAVGALSEHPIVVTGDHSVRHLRLVEPLLEGLKQLGVKVNTMRGDGYAPVIVQGPLRGGKAVVMGQDSQPISGLLIASAFSESPTEIIVKNAGEKPWVALTLNWFERLGIVCENHAFERYVISGGQIIEGFDYSIPGDLSSASFPIAAALVTDCELTIKNVDLSEPQGDKELIYTFQRMGANIEIDHANKAVIVKRGSQLKGIEVDINAFVDAITILAVVACYAEGKTLIKNAAVAKQKECNRIAATASELRKMGAIVEELEDGLMVEKSSLIGTKVYSHADHRMAMSLSVAALGAKGETQISDVECISKTFPTFLNCFQSIGADMQLLA